MLLSQPRWMAMQQQQQRASMLRDCCCCPESIMLSFSGSSTLSTVCYSAFGAIDNVNGLAGRYKLKSLDMSGDHVIPLESVLSDGCSYQGLIPNALVLEQYRQDGGGFCDVLVADCTFDVRATVDIRLSDDGSKSVASVTIEYIIGSGDWCDFTEDVFGQSSGILFFATLPTCVKAPITCKRYGDSIPDDNTSTGGTVDAYGGTVVIDAV